jgi:TIR domain
MARRRPASRAKSVGAMRDAPDLPRQGIFISYRHADSVPHARLLQLNLRERFPEVPVFMDVDSIEAGLDFAKVISDAINSSEVMVVLIGPQWATLSDDEGQRRLDDPDDYVRFEIRTALNRGIRVIPVLVEAAKPPRRQDLPPDLRRLARLNALEMSCDHRYQYDADRLMSIIERALAR